jgi:hypothetical protein
MSITRKSADSTVRSKLTENDSIGQSVTHPHFTRAPLLSEVPVQGFVLGTYNGASYIHTRIGNAIFKVQVS